MVQGYKQNPLIGTNETTSARQGILFLSTCVIFAYPPNFAIPFCGREISLSLPSKVMCMLYPCAVEEALGWYYAA
jgi:hypothetical protein